jgi:hypothetical protein
MPIIFIAMKADKPTANSCSPCSYVMAVVIAGSTGVWHETAVGKPDSPFELYAVT